MNNLREEYFKLEKLAETNQDFAINKMIDIFQDISESYEHDIYNSIIQWIGLKGSLNTLQYLNQLNLELYDEDTIELLNELKSKIEQRIMKGEK
jgi:hypothetical protein